MEYRQLVWPAVLTVALTWMAHAAITTSYLWWVGVAVLTVASTYCIRSRNRAHG